MKRSAVLATIIAIGLVFHADAKSYTPVFTEDFENAATWHDNVQYGSVSNAYFKMATLNLGGTDYQLSQAVRTLADGVSTTKFYQQASDDNQKRNSAFIIPDSVLSGLGTDYVLEFDLGFNAPYAKNYSTDYCAGLSVNDANGLPLLTIGTVYGNGNGEKNTGYIYRRDDTIDDAIASGFRVTGRDGVITNSAYAKNWLHVKLAVSGSSMSVTATLADGTVLCSDAAVSADITSPVKYLGLRSWNNGNYNLARCGLDNISISKAIEGTFVWTGEAGDGHWSNPGNWQISGLSVASAPGAGDSVSISDATVAIDPDFDLPSVTATLSNAKIAVLFTDSALSYTVPTGFAAGDFVALGPYSVEVSDGVITATRIPSSFVWTPSAGNWADVANWTVGGLPTGVVPGETDTAVFSDNATAVLSNTYNISNLVVATSKKLTLNGGMLANIYEYGTASEKGGTVALNGSELRSYNISASSASWYGDIEIAGGVSVTNYIRATISTQGASGTLKLYGNLSGDGCVVLHVVGHNTGGQPDGQGGVSLYGDNQNFEGIGIIWKGGQTIIADRRHSVRPRPAAPRRGGSIPMPSKPILVRGLVR